MLTEKQREVVEAYYNEDLSLAEIAEDRDITRQGVRDAIKRAGSSCWRWRNGWAWQSLQEVQKRYRDLRLRGHEFQGAKQPRRPGIRENAGGSWSAPQEISMEA